MKFFYFFEGETEKNILTHLIPYVADIAMWQNRNFPQEQFKTQAGKDAVLKNFKDIIGPIIELGEPIRCLIMLDLDLDVHRNQGTLKNTKLRTENAIEELSKQGREFSLNLARLNQYNGFPNVFYSEDIDLNIRICLHIADYKYSPDFVRSCTDDYLIQLLLCPSVADSLIKKFKNDLRRDDWTIKGEQLVHKVTNEIPKLLSDNGIPLGKDVKNYIRIYLEVLQASFSPSVFAGKAVANAIKNCPTDVQTVFESLIEAIKFLK